MRHRRAGLVGHRSRGVAWLAAAVLGGVSAGGCGPALYTFDILPASSAVHSAEQAGAAEWSPYEYWTAYAYLDKAAEEANEGNYQDAIRFAERAREMGELAQRRTSERMREARQAGASP